MEGFTLFMCGGLLIAGLTTIVTGFKPVPREPAGLPPAQLIIDRTCHLGASRSRRIRVRRNRLIGGVLILVLATLALLGTVAYSLAHMRFGLSGSWFPGN
jgi:hypothetical protein